MENISACEQYALRIRKHLIQMAHHSKAAHLGSALSCVDLLVALYWKVLSLDNERLEEPDRERFLLSKGHATASLYAVLAYKNFFSKDLLSGYCEAGHLLEDHPGPFGPPGVEAATGSLGHGLSLGAGMALAYKIRNYESGIYVLMSDGECNEGSVWEAAMFASGKKLGNLYAIIDFNKWQATGRSLEVSGLGPLADKWKSFGWITHEVDGHHIDEVANVLIESKASKDKPVVLIAHTVKGKGISFMEDDNNWHYRVPDKKDVQIALKELERIKDE